MCSQLHAVRPQRPGDAAERGVLPLLPGAVGPAGEGLPASARESRRVCLSSTCSSRIKRRSLDCLETAQRVSQVHTGFNKPRHKNTSRKWCWPGNEGNLEVVIINSHTHILHRRFFCLFSLGVELAALNWPINLFVLKVPQLKYIWYQCKHFQAEGAK